MILVTGSTGNVGSEVVKQLAQAGHKVRALVRDTKEASGKFPTTVDIVAGDLDNTDSLVNAMKGVSAVYLLAPFSPAVAKQEGNALEAAKRSGVKRIVKHSVLGAQWEGISIAKWHRASEKAIEASGVPWTHIRPSGFFPNALNWAGMIKNGGTVYYPTGQGKLGVVDVRDIAAVAVKPLTENGHEGKAYDVTGAQALTSQEQVDIIGKAIGKQLTYVDVPNEAAKDSMLGQGMPAPLVDALLEFCDAIKSGQAAAVTDTVQQLTGKPPRTFEAWAKENAAAFR
ncbi:MAG: SDR family oxidoreductase [Deltaproteobacteria bacterium]|nr:SDR family oxidoreductase [Deltaproteobacteria bacterium]